MSKYWIIILAFCFGSLRAQKDNPFTNNLLSIVVKKYKTDIDIYHFHAFGDTAEMILAGLYQLEGKKPSDNPIHRFRGIKVDGIPDKMTIKVMDGVMQDKGGGDWAIRTYRNKKDKENKPTKIPEGYREVKQIYFENNHLIKFSYPADMLDSKEKKDVAENFLLNLIE